MRKWGWPCAVGFVFMLFAFGGCNAKSLDGWMQDGQRWTVDVYRSLLSLGFGPAAKKAPAGSAPGQMTEELISSDAAKNAKANQELFHEMFLVVFQIEPQSTAEFGNWVDSLNQGASLEGVYHGLVLSDQYRALEKVRRGSLAPALQIFGEELAYIELEFPQPAEFDTSDALPFPRLGNVSEVVEPPVSTGFGEDTSRGLASQATQKKADLKTLAEAYSKQFVGASIFSLKRILGDEALRMMNLKNQYREKLALWYSKWVLRLIQRKVDFGLDLRNKADEAFHYKWAVEMPEDRLKWEVLNRLHRVMNEANREK